METVKQQVRESTLPNLEDYPVLNNKQLYQVLYPLIKSDFHAICQLALKINSALFHAKLECSFIHKRRDYTLEMDPETLFRSTKFFNQVKMESQEYTVFQTWCQQSIQSLKGYIVHFTQKKAALEEIQVSMERKIKDVKESSDPDDSSLKTGVLTGTQSRIVIVSKIILELINNAASIGGISSVSLADSSLLEENLVRLRDQIDKKGKPCGYTGMARRSWYSDSSALPVKDSSALLVKDSSEAAAAAIDPSPQQSTEKQLPSFKETYAEIATASPVEIAAKSTQTLLDPASTKKTAGKTHRRKKEKPQQRKATTKQPKIDAFSWVENIMKR